MYKIVGRFFFVFIFFGGAGRESTTIKISFPFFHFQWNYHYIIINTCTMNGRARGHSTGKQETNIYSLHSDNIQRTSSKASIWFMLFFTSIQNDLNSWDTYLSSIFYCYRSALSHKSATSIMTSQITVIWKVLLWLHKKGFKHWGENKSGNSKGYTLRKGFKETAMLLGYVQSSQARAEESRFLMTFK